MVVSRGILERRATRFPHGGGGGLLDGLRYAGLRRVVRRHDDEVIGRSALSIQVRALPQSQMALSGRKTRRRVRTAQKVCDCTENVAKNEENAP